MKSRKVLCLQNWAKRRCTMQTPEEAEVEKDAALPVVVIAVEVHPVIVVEALPAIVVEAHPETVVEVHPEIVVEVHPRIAVGIHPTEAMPAEPTQKQKRNSSHVAVNPVEETKARHRNSNQRYD